ncbi:MAG TPA: cytochrome c oxidase assembly protein [Candidatus Limnocylindrales bacterium]|nr:cytochrome c oxidase assembly protein [Candidatus Limnocylindrales bacterium]
MMVSNMVALHASLSISSWSFDPTVIAGTLAIGAAYVWLARSGFSQSPAWSPVQRLSFSAALLVLFLALESPIDVGGDHYLFSFHMLQHILLAMVVPPLLLCGLPEAWLAIDRLRITPLGANLLFTAVLAVWHLPFLYEATLYNGPVHVAEHLTFLAAGVIFWWPIVAPGGRRSLTPIGKIAYLGFAGVPPTVLGIAFIMSRSVLYPFYALAPRVLPLQPLDDQRLAGLVMFGLGNIIYFVVISIIFFGLDDKEATAGELDAPAPADARASVKA